MRTYTRVTRNTYLSMGCLGWSVLIFLLLGVIGWLITAISHL